jgi:prevent-host-death family protein
MKVSATEFKAKCLSLIDRVQAGDEVVITKHGRTVARLVAEPDVDEKPWLALRRVKGEWKGDPFAPAVDDDEIEALR